MNEKEAGEFISLFDPFPNTAIYHIDNGCKDIVQLVADVREKLEGDLTFQSLNEIEQKKFRLKDRNFEYAIASDCLDKVEHQDRFISALYHSLENSAFIIIIQFKGTIDIETMKDILDRNNFRAVNDIDIFEDYHLVMAKKLHMWGNGM
jgi:hypothetical protein